MGPPGKPNVTGSVVGGKGGCGGVGHQSPMINGGYVNVTVVGGGGGGRVVVCVGGERVGGGGGRRVVVGQYVVGKKVST